MRTSLNIRRYEDLCWWSIPVPEPYQAGCHPVENQVGVWTGLGRWSVRRWASICELEHPIRPDFADYIALK